jgi:hypothetical protein
LELISKPSGDFLREGESALGLQFCNPKDQSSLKRQLIASTARASPHVTLHAPLANTVQSLHD